MSEDFTLTDSMGGGEEEEEEEGVMAEKRGWEPEGERETACERREQEINHGEEMGENDGMRE